MIVDEVRMFLDGVAAPERIDVYTRILSLLESRDITTANYYIMELIATREQYENMTLIHRMDDIMYEQLFSAFEDIGITVNEDTGVPELCVLLEAALSIEECEDKEMLNSLIESADDKEEAICKVLSFVSGHPEETFSLMVTDVKEDTLVAISALYEDTTEDNNDTIRVPDNVDGQYEKIKERVKLYLMAHPDCPIKDIVAAGIRLRENWMTYFDYLVKNGILDFTALPTSSLPSKEEKKAMEKTVEQFMAISLMAGVSSDEAVSYITETVMGAALSPGVVANLLAIVKDTAPKVIPHG